ncbi:hypothetical protein CSB20_11170 [bacterium DOLZORAL124_64_63]|nr:MAG: hypothetical protein CSB20_11170 [bacterium DOLZORAL124_64_63]
MLHLTYRSEYRQLHIVVEQHLDFIEFRTTLLQFRKAYPTAQWYSTLWDLTRLPVQALLEGDLGLMTRSIMGGRGRTLDLALVVSARATTGLGRTYLSRLGDEMESIQIFRSHAKAEKWLAERLALRQKEARS